MTSRGGHLLLCGSARHSKSIFSVNLFFLFVHMEVVTQPLVWVNRQCQLKLVLGFFFFCIGGYGSIFLSPVKPPSYLRLKNTYPRRYRPIKQLRGALVVLSECKTRTLDASIVATSHGPYGPDGPRAPDTSITYVFRSRSVVAFTYLCFVI